MMKSEIVDKRLSLYVVLYFVVLALNATLKTVLTFSDQLSSYISMFFGALLMVVMIRSIGEVMRRKGRLLSYSLILFAVLYAFSVIASGLRGEPSNAIRAILVDSAFWTFAWWIPVGVFAASVNDYSILYKTFLRWSFILFFILIFMVLFHRPSDKEYGFDYSMTFGNTIIIPIMLHLNEYFQKKHRGLLLVALIEILLLFIYANRSVLLSVVFFVFMTILKNTKGGAKAFYALLLVVGGGIMIVFQESIINGMISLFESFGFRSRTLVMMANDAFFESTERDELFAFTKGMILERPLLGWGLGGEFYHIAMGLYGYPIASSVFSPHNGVLENLVNFGIFGGSLATLMIVRPFFNINKNKNPYVNVLILISGAACLPMFFSAAGFFRKPIVALFLYLYYFSNTKRKDAQ